MALKTRLISFGWGVAEATFFFLVPDIWLTRIALINRKEAFINILIATCGALIGGMIMYIFGLVIYDQVAELLSYIPAISKDMIIHAEASMTQDNYLVPMLEGSFSGTPYKIYALLAAEYHIPFILFLFASLLARLPRFILVVVFAMAVDYVLRSKLSHQNILYLHVMLWCLFYVCFFYTVGIF